MQQRLCPCDSSLDFMIMMPRSKFLRSCNPMENIIASLSYRKDASCVLLRWYEQFRCATKQHFEMKLFFSREIPTLKLKCQSSICFALYYYIRDSLLNAYYWRSLRVCDPLPSCFSLIFWSWNEHLKIKIQITINVLCRSKYERFFLKEGDIRQLKFIYMDQK